MTVEIERSRSTRQVSDKLSDEGDEGGKHRHARCIMLSAVCVYSVMECPPQMPRLRSLTAGLEREVPTCAAPAQLPPCITRTRGPALHLPHTTIPPANQHGSSLSSRRLTLAGSAQVQAEVAARHQALAVAVAVQSQSRSQSHFLLHLHPRAVALPPLQTAVTTRQDETMQGQQEGTRDGICRGRGVRANGLFTRVSRYDIMHLPT